MAKQKPPTIHVVLDTNCLFTEAADRLLSLDISEFILASAQELGLQISWYLPSVVKAERKYQMLDRARKLLPSLAKMESLLGHALGISEDVLDGRVDDAIRRQIDAHRLKELTIVPDRVAWDQLINRALLRQPPFDPGDKEKGFRDALILEALFQLVEGLPRSNNAARIVLLSADKLVQDAARERLKERANVVIVENLDALRTMLNAVASQLTQEVINSVIPRAQKIFFEPNNFDTLYYKAKVWEKITTEFSDIYKKPPEVGFIVSVERILVGPVTFLNKDRQRLSFSSKITVELEAKKFQPRNLSALPTAGLGLMSPSGPSVSSVAGSTTNTLANFPGLLNSPTAQNKPSALGDLSQFVEELKRRGSTVFEANWEVTFNRKGTLVNPHLMKIEHRSSSWEE
jgi:hypothetical protein